jgi:hypothetical protein
MPSNSNYPPVLTMVIIALSFIFILIMIGRGCGRHYAYDQCIKAAIEADAAYYDPKDGSKVIWVDEKVRRIVYKGIFP